MNGTIKWYNSRKGYGFIIGEDGKDVFIHHTNIPQGVYLHEGDNIEYETEETERGLQAKIIKKL